MSKTFEDLRSENALLAEKKEELEDEIKIAEKKLNKIFSDNMPRNDNQLNMPKYILDAKIVDLRAELENLDDQESELENHIREINQKIDKLNACLDESDDSIHDHIHETVHKLEKENKKLVEEIENITALIDQEHFKNEVSI